MIQRSVYEPLFSGPQSSTNDSQSDAGTLTGAAGHDYMPSTGHYAREYQAPGVAVGWAAV